MKTINNMTLIDDDEVFVFLTKKAIERTHLVELIRVFSNGLDAIDFLRENSNNVDALPEIILLDLSMPIMDGWQFLDEIQTNPEFSKIPTYILTSSIDPSDKSKSQSFPNVKGYLTKPLTLKDLETIQSPNKSDET